MLSIAAATFCLPPPGVRAQSLPVPAQGEIPVAVVLGKDAEVLDFTGPLEVFAHAQTPDGHPLFKPYFVAASKDALRVSGGLCVVPDYTFADAPAPKVVVIPALSEPPPALLDWIRRVSAGTDVTMSVCTGAFVLADTGLLDGKPATTHHGVYLRFAGTYNVLTPEEKAKVQVVFVSVDPARDTPEHLRGYVPFYNAAFLGATGTPDELTRTAKAYGVFYAMDPSADPAKPGEYNVTHSAYVYLIDKASR